jgi:hypothetical protein
MTVKRLGDKLLSIRQDENTLHFYRMREMAISDYISGMNAAYEKGKKTGLPTTLRSSGFSIEEIAGEIKGTTEEIIKILEAEGLT